MWTALHGSFSTKNGEGVNEKLNRRKTLILTKKIALEQ
jgi:hypothetical protein